MPDSSKSAGLPRAESQSSTSSRLLLAAAELFWEKGFSGASTRELSERLGIQKASLYYHIRSKDDLLYEISIRSLDDIQQAVVTALANAPIEGRLQALVHAHLRTALEERHMHATQLTELRSMSEERRSAVLARRDAYERTVIETIRAEQAAGRLRMDLDARYLGLGLLNLLNWTIFWYRPEGPKAIEELADFFCDLYINGAAADR